MQHNWEREEVLLQEMPSPRFAEGGGPGIHERALLWSTHCTLMAHTDERRTPMMGMQLAEARKHKDSEADLFRTPRILVVFGKCGHCSLNASRERTSSVVQTLDYHGEVKSLGLHCDLGLGTFF